VDREPAAVAQAKRIAERNDIDAELCAGLRLRYRYTDQQRTREQQARDGRLPPQILMKIFLR
jgi:hypothetical protein